jgi:CubicO group peptidase (beta-lactamase class C family)
VSLHLAALQGNVQAIQQHIDAGTDLNAKDAFGSTPLVIATTFGHTDAARSLIEGGADLEIAGSEGSTPLQIAAFLCRTEIVQALLDHGANRYVRDKYGHSALDAVAAPFDDVKGIYDNLAKGLAPLGLKLDYDHLRKTRPKIVQMLRPGPEDLVGVDYAPAVRDDWKVSTPKEQGLDPNLVAELYLDATGVEKLYSILIVKNGCLVAERYFNDGSIDHKNRLCSVTKSYTSALAGIALAQGHLTSVDQKMLDFFPEIAGQITDPRKKRITIRHMLQMRAGYPWEETEPKLWDGLLSGHYPPLIETFPLLGEPGTQYNYSNLTSNWLGIILARACGENLKPFSQEHLLSPIGAEAGEWGMDAEGHNNGCGNLHMTSRDMAKFGLLYLNGGAWNGKQVVPAAWVKDSLTDYSPDTWVTPERVDHKGTYFRDIGYGYQWWSAQAGAHHVDLAAGHGGQYIVLLHDLDMVIVATSYPFFLQHDAEAWKHEKSTMNLVGKFVHFLPKE